MLKLYLGQDRNTSEATPLKDPHQANSGERNSDQRPYVN